MDFQFRKQEKSQMKQGLVGMKDVALTHFCVSQKNCCPKAWKLAF